MGRVDRQVELEYGRYIQTLFVVPNSKQRTFFVCVCFFGCT